MSPHQVAVQALAVVVGQCLEAAASGADTELVVQVIAHCHQYKDQQGRDVPESAYEREALAAAQQLAKEIGKIIAYGI